MTVPMGETDEETAERLAYEASMTELVALPPAPEPEPEADEYRGRLVLPEEVLREQYPARRHRDAQGRYWCPFCEREPIGSDTGWYSHMNSHRPPVPCRFCDKPYSPATLASHEKGCKRRQAGASRKPPKAPRKRSEATERLPAVVQGPDGDMSAEGLLRVLAAAFRLEETMPLACVMDAAAWANGTLALVAAIKAEQGT